MSVSVKTPQNPPDIGEMLTITLWIDSRKPHERILRGFYPLINIFATLTLMMISPLSGCTI
jgi:hypothetical protein